MTLLRLGIILPVLALLPSIHNSNCIINHPLLFVYANVPPTSSRGSRFTRKRNKSRSGSSSDASSDGLTLGDLEALQMQSDNIGGGTFFPSEAIFGKHHEQREQLNQSSVPKEDESTSIEQSAHQPARRRSLRRINLDLSGRVMCHVLSPKIIQNNEDGDGIPAIQMDSVPLFEATSSRFESDNKTLRRRLKRHIPHVYIGANYDLDEVWYGATRWIAKCSWCLPKQSKFDGSKPVRQLVESIFPTTAATRRSAWRLDLEREHSVFEHSDSTTRVSLVQQQSYLSSTVVQNLSVEYDSAKYSNNNSHDMDNPTTTSSLVQAPTISVNVQTPILHPRIELRTKKTWILRNGGDKHGNYYGGTHFGSYSPVERRLESIRDDYRAMVPRSQLLNFDDDSKPSMSTAATTLNRLQSFGWKLSNWLEQDGWMPKRVTTDLMGNFVSVNEVGFYSETTSNDSNNHNMGIRLQISKRIDWTSLGIFPWSNNNSNHHNNSPTTPTRVRLDLCGLHKSGNSKSQIGCEFDPLCLGDTFRVVIGHDGVGA